ncbi:hypothetical protein [Tenacibaculum sp. UWU-22]|uniref:hypothetical protein n=1 Tax=Tenacibaculum sp. UWU-22 TaxID=3234187 RepID=UPI0034DABF65
MKKILVAFALCITSFLYAQNELSLDLGDALVMKTLEVSYERYIESQSSVGISALFNFEKTTADFRYNEKRMFTPFFRQYFTSDKTFNYFGELFLGFNSGEKKQTVDNVTNYIKYNDGMLGISAGAKYTSNGGFTANILAGAARNMFNSDSPAIVPRVGINVGYRF